MYMIISVFLGLNYLGFLAVQNELVKKTGPPETSLLLERQVTNNPVTALIIVSAVHFLFFKLKFSRWLQI